MLVWSAVLAVSFELARRARAYDYRSFSKLLLGRGWFLFEIAYFLLIVLILAVMGAAAGEIVHSLFGVPRLAGSLAMIAGVGLRPVPQHRGHREVPVPLRRLSLSRLSRLRDLEHRWRSATASRPPRRGAGRTPLVHGRRHLRGLQRGHHPRRPVLRPPPDPEARGRGGGPAGRSARHAARAWRSTSR